MKKILFNLLLIFLLTNLINANGTCVCNNPKYAWHYTCPNWQACDSYCMTRGGTHYWSGIDTWD